MNFQELILLLIAGAIVLLAFSSFLSWLDISVPYVFSFIGGVAPIGFVVIAIGAASFWYIQSEVSKS